jgi:hypothetical protein
LSTLGFLIGGLMGRHKGDKGKFVGNKKLRGKVFSKEQILKDLRGEL